MRSTNIPRGMSPSRPAFSLMVVMTLLLSSILVLTASDDVQAAGSTVTLTPVADTNTNYTYQGNNFGTSTKLATRDGYDNLWIKFDLSAVTANLTSATLRLYVVSTPAVTQTMNLSRADSAWTETGLTYDNKPTRSGYIMSSFAGSSGLVGTYWEMDVTTYVQAVASGSVTNHGWQGALQGNVGTLVDFASKESANSPQLVIVYPSSTPSTGISLIESASNPLFSGGHVCESSIIMDGTRMDMWVPSGSSFGDGDYSNLWYTYATDALLTNFANPIKVLDDVRFPTVAKSGSTYYLFALKDVGTDLFCWTSTDKTTWTPANGGNAVLHRSASGTSQWYYFWNPGVVIVDNVMYLWMETATQTGMTNQLGVRLGYSHSTVAAMNFDTYRTETNIVNRGGNAWATYVPDRNAIILMYGKLMTGTTLWQIHASTVSLSSDLGSAASYTESANFVLGPSNEHTADPAFGETPTGKTHKMVFEYYHNQPTSSDLYQAYSNLTLNQFYDALTGDEWSSSSWAPTFTSTPDGNAVVGDAWSYHPTCNETVSWHVQSGDVPAWATWDGSSFSGTPTGAGTFGFAVTAEGAGGLPLTQTFSVVVTAAAVDDDDDDDSDFGVDDDTGGSTVVPTKTVSRSIWWIIAIALLGTCMVAAIVMRQKGGSKRRG